MKNYTFISISIIFTCLLLGSCTQPSTDATEEISKANQEFLKVFNSTDKESITQFYTDDARLLPANSKIIKGKANIEAFWQGAAQMGVHKAELKTTEAEKIGNTAIEEGSYTLYASNKMVIDVGKYIVIWKYIDDKWLIHKDMFSSNNPLPELPQVEE